MQGIYGLEQMGINKLNIWVYGAGAVGCFYGSKLIESGNNVLFVSRGAQLRALKSQGLKITSCDDDFYYKDVQCCSEEELENQTTPDLVIVSVKSYSNREVANKLSKLLSDDSAIFVFQNGINSEHLYRKICGEKKTVRVILNIAAKVESPGKIFHKSGGKVIIEDKHSLSQRLFDEFHSVNVDCQLVKDIKNAIWNKILWNASFNTVTALSKLTTAPIVRDQDGLNLLKAIAEEVISLAKSNHVYLESSDFEKQLEFTQEKLGDITTSTREDVLEGKRIEYQAIVGDLIDEAKRLSIRTPYLFSVYTLLKLLDKSFER